jgi:hypothetical protein
MLDALAPGRVVGNELMLLDHAHHMPPSRQVRDGMASRQPLGNKGIVGLIVAHRV